MRLRPSVPRAAAALLRAAAAALAVVAAAAPAPAGAALDASNVASLQLKWDLPLGTSVTSSPVVANGLVYATAWNGIVYALDPDDGSIVWSFDTLSSVSLGVQGSVLVTPSGDVCFGDSLAHVWCRDGLTGAPIWDKVVGNPAVDHVWSALAQANGRLFVSLASHSDQPCTKGRVRAFDLATGADLWTFQTVPDKICTTDTATVCTLDADCPAGGTCVDALGAGVTATVATDPTGAFVYMNTVGCYTFPSVGDSDSVFKLDAATGAVVWKTRVDAPEQFGACSHDPSIDCGTDATCGVGNTCQTKSFYHDFGFLNGPIPVDVGGSTLLVSGSKNGTLYAFDEATGAIVWSHAVAPKPVSPAFAGFGLFNGPLAVADGRVHAALFDFIPSLNPDPEHLQAFDVATGAVLWTDEIGFSWSGVGAANGLVFAGNNQFPFLYAYDAATGQRRASFMLPAATVSVATVDGETLYVGYGLLGPVGGIRAYETPPPPGLSKCRRALAKETAAAAIARTKALAKCEVAKIKGTLGAGVVCERDDPKTIAALAKVEGKRTAKIAGACGGVDKTCGGDDTDESTSLRIGFASTCPGLEGLGTCAGGADEGDVCTGDPDCTGGTCVPCDGPIDPDTCTDGDACARCIATLATKRMNGLLTDGLAPTDPAADKAANKCQQEIQKSTWKLWAARAKVVQQCWDKQLLGKHADPCPDPSAPLGSVARKAADKLAKATAGATAKICKTCGGADGICGGGDDLPLAGLYGPAPTCPAVTVPSAGTACGAIAVTDVAGLVACLACTTDFGTDCATAAAVPALLDYPSVCQ